MNVSVLRDPPPRTTNGPNTSCLGLVLPLVTYGSFPIAAVFLFSSKPSALYQYNRFDFCGWILVFVLEFLASTPMVKCT